MAGTLPGSFDGVVDGGVASAGSVRRALACGPAGAAHVTAAISLGARTRL